MTAAEAVADLGILRLERQQKPRSLFDDEDKAC